MKQVTRSIEEGLDRRDLCKVLATGALGIGAMSMLPSVATAQTVRQGFGTYLIPGLSVSDSNQQVNIQTTFAFDTATGWISCLALFNTEPFIFPTAQLGRVTIPAYGFLMQMLGTPRLLDPAGNPTGIRLSSSKTRGRSQIFESSGTVLSITQLNNVDIPGTGSFSGTLAEFVPFNIEAVTQSSSNEDTFEMTNTFSLPLGQTSSDGLERGGQLEIFGSNASFGGTLIAGAI